jgi:hypothetical protein
MMEPANLRNRDDPATCRGFHDSWLGTVVVERLVWPRGVVVTDAVACSTVSRARCSASLALSHFACSASISGGLMERGRVVTGCSQTGHGSSAVLLGLVQRAIGLLEETPGLGEALSGRVCLRLP